MKIETARRDVGRGFREHDPRIFYGAKYAPVQNFGDYLPELLCKALLLHPKVDATVFCLVGSNIDNHWAAHTLRKVAGRLTGQIAYWGNGMRKAGPLDPKIQSHCLFFGIRGPLSRDSLGLPADTVLGDPGLLVPLIHQNSTDVSTSGRTICVPHIHDPKSDGELLELSGADMVVRPAIQASEAALRGVIDEIVGAEFVLTASLHGAIIASAYRRPFAFWDNGHIDLPFKWQDFAASVAISATFVPNLKEGRRLYERELEPALSLPPLAPILDICPFQARPAALLRAMAYDGVIAADAVQAAVCALDRLPSTNLAAVCALQDLSSQARAERSSPIMAFQSALGLNIRNAKRAVFDVMNR